MASQNKLTPLQQACEWYVHLLEQPEDTAQHQAWLNASDKHQQAWLRIQQFNQRCQILPPADWVERTLQSADTAAKISRRQALSLFVLSGVTSLTAWSAYQSDWDQMIMAQLEMMQADYKTAMGEQLQVALSPEARLWLNSNTAIQRKEGPDSTQIHLLKGEVFYRQNARWRAFEAWLHYAQVKGQSENLAFSLARDQAHCSLCVFEGEVSLVLSRLGSETLVKAGQQLSFSASSLGDIQVVEAYRQSWLSGVLVVDNWPLQRVMNEFNRYHRQTVQVAESLQAKRLTGRYQLDQFEQSLQMIAMSLGARLEQPRWRAWRMVG